MATTPTPPGWIGGAPDGTMMRKGSAGRISLPTQTEWDPDDEERCNYAGLNGLDPGEQNGDADDTPVHGYSEADSDYFSGPDENES